MGLTSFSLKSWDEDVATMAQAWADRCQWAHGQVENITPFQGLGQNLYLTTAVSAPNVNSVVDKWHSEVQWYNYDVPKCNPPPNKFCGHYKQVSGPVLSKVCMPKEKVRNVPITRPK